ncbi:MAG: 16S rRNA (guanine(966)-N(2))-methyltransferase RsmD [Candidatus Izimaplasma sp.]|nr:16S rRNA (guanine(966)-N(2))-methyltransferase RsmD [Candidatus Izimaplasma bacterium]
MRVISGKYKRKTLKQVAKSTTRETKDRVKESIFNSINFSLPNAHVLDLFAGSGALGIESLSRGAISCVFVDQNSAAIKTIEENLSSLSDSPKTTVIKTDYQDFLVNKADVYDIILLDPPYDLKKIPEILEYLSTSDHLSKEGRIICLFSKKDSVKDDINDIIKYKEKRIGITTVAFFKRRQQ